MHTLHHDDFAWKLAEHLLEDLGPFVSDRVRDAVKEAIASRSVHKFRSISVGSSFEQTNPHSFKAERQLLELFKKFSFSQDLMTPEEVLEDSKSKFLANQVRLDSFTLPEDAVVNDVCFRARGIIDSILGEFSKFDVLERATFGKKSSVGIPMRKACEGSRYEAPITGSREHIDWFQHMYSCWNRPAYLYACRRAEGRKAPLYREIDTLEAVLVDKTFKSKRLIMPNTTLGTLYSGGLGHLLADRLREFGYDIKHLQGVHGQLAKIGSITGTLVTADQSLASDNITTLLIERLFLREWADALKRGRIAKVSFYGHTFESKTFASMGIGFTFPLQTLVFLGLLIAIRDHLSLDEQTVISVYGDDLIYDDRLHDLVMEIFPKLGLVINADKTFATGYFRESCGQDYFRGIDVRPFYLAKVDGSSSVKKNAEAYLYKTINGLCRRWSKEELPCVTSFIISQLILVRDNKTLFEVPPDFPDTAGIKVSRFSIGTNDLYETRNRRDIHGTYRFSYLGFVPDMRDEIRHEPYLYLALRKEAVTDRLAEFAVTRIPKRAIPGTITEASVPIFKTLALPTRGTKKGMSDMRLKAPSRSKLSGLRVRPTLTVIPEMERGRYREQTGITSNWITVEGF